MWSWLSRLFSQLISRRWFSLLQLSCHHWIWFHTQCLSAEGFNGICWSCLWDLPVNVATNASARKSLRKRTSNKDGIGSSSRSGFFLNRLFNRFLFNCSFKRNSFHGVFCNDRLVLNFIWSLMPFIYHWQRLKHLVHSKFFLYGFRLIVLYTLNIF